MECSFLFGLMDFIVLWLRVICVFCLIVNYRLCWKFFCCFVMRLWEVFFSFLFLEFWIGLNILVVWMVKWYDIYCIVYLSFVVECLKFLFLVLFFFGYFLVVIWLIKFWILKGVWLLLVFMLLLICVKFLVNLVVCWIMGLCL